MQFLLICFEVYLQGSGVIQYFVFVWMEIRSTSTVAIHPIVSATSAMFLKLVVNLFPIVSLFITSNLRMGRTNLETEGCPDRRFISI